VGNKLTSRPKKNAVPQSSLFCTHSPETLTVLQPHRKVWSSAECSSQRSCRV